MGVRTARPGSAEKTVRDIRRATRRQYSAEEKIRIVLEGPRIREAGDYPHVVTSPLPVRRTLAQIGIPKSTFYAWLDRYAAGALERLEDHRPRPARVWNCAPFVGRGKPNIDAHVLFSARAHDRLWPLADICMRRSECQLSGAKRA